MEEPYLHNTYHGLYQSNNLAKGIKLCLTLKKKTIVVTHRTLKGLKFFFNYHNYTAKII